MVIDIEDAFGNIVTTSSATVAMTVATGGSTPTGTTSVAAHAGVATFSNVVLSKLGKYTLKGNRQQRCGGDLRNLLGRTRPRSQARSSIAHQPQPLARRSALYAGDRYRRRVRQHCDDEYFTVKSHCHRRHATDRHVLAAKAGIAITPDPILTKAAAKYTLKATDGTPSRPRPCEFRGQSRSCVEAGLRARTRPQRRQANRSALRWSSTWKTLGNIVTTNTSTVTLGISTGPTGGVLSGTVAVAAKAGVATFSNVQIKMAGSYALKATDGALASAKSSTIKVNAAAASKLVITKAPTPGKANTTLAVVVTIEDAFGNVTTTNTSKITFSIRTVPSGATNTGNAISADRRHRELHRPEAKQSRAYKLKATDLARWRRRRRGTVTITCYAFVAGRFRSKRRILRALGRLFDHARDRSR